MQYSGPLNRGCSCGKNHRVVRGMAHRGQFATQVLPVFPVSFWFKVLEAMCITLRDDVSIQKGSSQEYGDDDILGYSSSPWVTKLSSSPDSLMDSFGMFMAASHPALRRGFLSYPRFSYLRCCLSRLVYVFCSVVPAVADDGFGQVRGGVQDGAVEVLRGSSPVEDAGTRSWTSRVGVVGACGVSDYGAGQSSGSAGARNRDRSLSARAWFSSVSLQWVELDFVQFFALSSAPMRSQRFQLIRVQSLVMMDILCVQSQKNEWFTRVKSMKLVRELRWLFLPAPGWTRSTL